MSVLIIGWSVFQLRRRVRSKGKFWGRRFRAVQDTHWNTDERQGPRELPGEVESHGGHIGSPKRTV